MSRKRLAPKATQPKPHPVERRQVDRTGWEHAMRLAKKDASRIIIKSSTELIVLRRGQGA